MGTDILPGGVLEDGTLVHDADFNALVGNATILPTAISAKTLKPDMSLGDEFLINDAGTLKKVTGQQIVQVAVLPAGCMMQYAGVTEPLGWAFCFGQLFSRTTYAALFSAIGVTYGAGDGSTTFALPDCRGRTIIGDDNMGGTAAGRITTAGSGLDGTVLGAAGGSQTITLTTAHMPAHTHVTTDHLHAGTDHLHGIGNHTHYVMHHAHTYNEIVGTGGGWGPTGSGWKLASQTTGGVTAFTATSGMIEGGVMTGAADRSLTTGAADRTLTTTSAGSGTPYTNLQPSIIVNMIIKT